MRRLIFGGLAGLAATLTMTAAVRRIHDRIGPADEPFPLYDATDRLAARSVARRQANTVLANFGYGALAGVLYALVPANRRPAGVRYGLGMWAASQMGLVPSARILAPEQQTPLERGVLMLAAHVVWGVALSQGLKELDRVSGQILVEPPVEQPRLSWFRRRV